MMVIMGLHGVNSVQTRAHLLGHHQSAACWLCTASAALQSGTDTGGHPGPQVEIPADTCRRWKRHTSSTSPML